MKIIFAGTPQFAAVALQKLLDMQYEIVAVFTQPDRPAGRGQILTKSPVKLLAEKYQLTIFQHDNLKKPHDDVLKQLHADVMIVAAYGIILPEAFLNAFQYGCLNIHASLLPRWRGAAPIQRAILAGDLVTGVTIMQMEKGLDTGPMLLKKQCDITDSDTTETLHDKLAHLGAEAIIETLQNIDKLQPEIQDVNQVTYAHKIKKDESILDWNLSSQALLKKIAAFNPWPIATTKIDKFNIRIWKACSHQSTKKRAPGEIISSSNEGVDVATGDGAIRLLAMQFSGGKILSIKDILNGHAKTFSVGNKFD